MKILVLGAGGMAGHAITLRLMEYGHKIVGLAKRDLSFCKTLIKDAKDVESLGRIILSDKFDAVVNAIGILPGGINNHVEEAIFINSYLPHYLSNLLNKTDVKLVHLSTDCVFSGHGNGQYEEKSYCDANDYYGRTKALGEIIDNKNITFRTSIVGPDIKLNGSGLFNWFMQQANSVKGFSRTIWTGVSTITLADAIHAALLQNISGLYHLVNGDEISKYNLLKLFNDLRREQIAILCDDKNVSNKSLVNTRTDFNFTVPKYEKMIAEMGAWINKYKKYYPHYDLKEIV